MQISFSNINFWGRPDNYGVVDDYLTRSAQPQKEDFAWLKEQGITDVFNFRTMYSPDINFDEEAEVKKAGLRYHNIPSITTKPTKENIDTFLNEIEDVKKRGGKAHLHCKAGADRTGMYVFIYEMKNGIKDMIANLAEWYGFGHHFKLYPDLSRWTIKFVKQFKK